MRLFTVGHGTSGPDEFVRLLLDAGIEQVVDVRRFPGSRRHPQFARDKLHTLLPAAGIDYRWEERLGGRRRTRPDSPNTGWRHPSFRAYADHLDSDEFRDAIGRVLTDARTRAVAVMCAEAVWWRCHRRLIADHVSLLADGEVLHLFHDGRRIPHPPSDFARVVGGRLVYDRSTAG